MEKDYWEMTKTQKYFHPLQSAKFREGMSIIRKNEKRKKVLANIIKYGHCGYADISHLVSAAKSINVFYRNSVGDMIKNAVDEEEYRQKRAVRDANK